MVLTQQEIVEAAEEHHTQLSLELNDDCEGPAVVAPSLVEWATSCEHKATLPESLVHGACRCVYLGCTLLSRRYV